MNKLRKTFSFLKENSYKMLSHIDMGEISHVFIIEKKRIKYALKVAKEEHAQANSLQLEYKIMTYLNANGMSHCLPTIEGWIKEVNGFLMEYVEYPRRSNRSILYSLADAIRTLHGVNIPEFKGIKDHRSLPGTTLIGDLRETFKSVISNSRDWKSLALDDKSKFETVRSKYEYYNRLLGFIEPLLNDTTCSLTHGDLAGDNIMVKKNGSLALIDWHGAAISIGLADIAYLSTYSQWDTNTVEQFLKVYFNEESNRVKKALPTIAKLMELYRYHSCIWSLCRSRIRSI